MTSWDASTSPSGCVGRDGTVPPDVCECPRMLGGWVRGASGLLSLSSGSNPVEHPLSQDWRRGPHWAPTQHSLLRAAEVSLFSFVFTGL